MGFMDVQKLNVFEDFIARIETQMISLMVSFSWTEKITSSISANVC